MTSNLSLGAEMLYQYGPQVPGGTISIYSLAGKYQGEFDHFLSLPLSNFEGFFLGRMGWGINASAVEHQTFLPIRHEASQLIKKKENYIRFEVSSKRLSPKIDILIWSPIP